MLDCSHVSHKMWSRPVRNAVERSRLVGLPDGDCPGTPSEAMKIFRNHFATDQTHHRLVSVISVLFAVGVCELANRGFFGQSSQEMMPLTSFILLLVFGCRAVLTELGIRRTR